MTPRKELFIKIKAALMQVPGLEYVDLYRNQFGAGKEYYPQYWTAALIRINNIQYETMTEGKQEGNATIDVLLYTKDGWTDQHNLTADSEHGLAEIDLIDNIAEALQFLQGDYFKPLQQTSDEVEDNSLEAIMSYRITFDTLIYRRIVQKYTNRKLTITN